LIALVVKNVTHSMNSFSNKAVGRSRLLFASGTSVEGGERMWIVWLTKMFENLKKLTRRRFNGRVLQNNEEFRLMIGM